MTALPAPLPLVGPSGSGEVHLHGAHLTSWTPAGGAPVLWTSAQARYEAGVAIRGGVPIVFPWFGAGRSGELSPAHGFARTATWRLLELGTDGDDALAVLALDSDDEQDGHHLVTAPPADDVGAPHEAAKAVGHLHQHLVARAAVVAVVERLEVVHADDEDRAGKPGPPRAAQL